MRKASLVAALVASLSLCSVYPCLANEGAAPVDEARVAEERLLGAADEDARFLGLQALAQEMPAATTPAAAVEGAPVDEARVADDRVPGTTDGEARFPSLQPFTQEVKASIVVELDVPPATIPAAAIEGVPVDEVRAAEEWLPAVADEEARFLSLQPPTLEIPATTGVDLDEPAATVATAVESAPVEQARGAEQLPGAAGEEARFLSLQPPTLEIAASAIVDLDVPAATMATVPVEGVPVDEARVAEEQLPGAAGEEARFLSLQPPTLEVTASAAADPEVPAAAVATAVESVPVDEARVAEEQILGAADDDARFLSLQPFTREIAASAVVKTSLDRALADLGVPAATMLEALRAFTTTVNLQRDVKPGDRLHVRYEQGFTAEGTPIGVGHVLWAELMLASRGPVAVHRFRTRDKVERLWFTNGLSATPPALRMPLDTISVSSGFGLRADPFDQPPPLAATGKPAPMGGPLRNKPLPPGLPTGSPSGNGGTMNLTTPLGASLGFAPYAGFGSKAPPKATTAPRSTLFMHEGIDLVALAGTPVYAAADGVVVGAAPNGRYGNWIRIEHGGSLATVYGHLMAFAPGIEPGESVVRGELIGFVGSTGRSTGAHLHFEVLDNGKPVNPITHPELKAMQLRGGDMDHFRKQVARSLEERTRESKVASGGL